MSNIEKADEKDAEELNRIISQEFSYKKFSKENILERMKRQNIAIFKCKVGKSLAGFIEVQLEQEAGVINAISVKKAYRGKGYAKELLNHALAYLKEKGLPSARLLVKQDNERAKKLYSAAGFEFSGIYEKKIEESTIEVWERKLNENESYLN